METESPAPHPAASTTANPEQDGSIVWVVIILAANDPLLLARVLQKLAVPELELLAVKFIAEDNSARIALRFRSIEYWAELLTAKLRKLATVHSVEMDRAERV